MLWKVIFSSGTLVLSQVDPLNEKNGSWHLVWAFLLYTVCIFPDLTSQVTLFLLSCKISLLEVLFFLFKDKIVFKYIFWVHLHNTFYCFSRSINLRTRVSYKNSKQNKKLQANDINASFQLICHSYVAVPSHCCIQRSLLVLLPFSHTMLHTPYWAFISQRKNCTSPSAPEYT